MDLPLIGRSVLVTRPRGEGSRLAELLVASGASVVLIPTIELVAPPSWGALDSALARLPEFDWLLFTSANAVRACARRAATLGLSLRPRRIAVIGPATGRAVEELGLAVDLMPSRYVAEGLAEALGARATPGVRMLLVRAAVGRDVLVERLGAGVTVAEAYQTVVPASSLVELGELLASRPPDAVTFTSASTAVNLAGLLEAGGLALPAGTVLASIGPITSGAMREVGMEPSVEAREATIGSLVEALISVLGR